MMQATLVGDAFEGEVKNVDPSADRLVRIGSDGTEHVYVRAMGSSFDIGTHGRRLNEQALFFHSTLLACGCVWMMNYVDAKGL